MMYGAIAFAAGLFLGMLAMQQLGHRIAMRRIAADPETAKKGAGVVEGAIFGLLSLLLAFTFSGAVSRFDVRRHLVNEEAVRIQTAWERIALLPDAAQPEMRALFRRYLDSRLETYRKPSVELAEQEWARSLELQHAIWTRGVAAGQASPTTTAGMLFFPAVNQMIDIARTRLAAIRIHPPPVIFGMLALLALIGALLAGYHMAGGKARSWLHTVGFAAVIAATVYVILDIEYPRFGFIRVDATDQLLIDVRHGMSDPH